MADLPDDPVLLRRIIEEQKADLAALHAEQEAQIAALEDRLAKAQAEAHDLRFELDVVLRRMFGRRTERVSDAQQLLFVDPDAAHALAEEPESGEAPPRKKRRKGGGGRKPLPAHLQRIEVTSAATGPTSCTCCGGELHEIGEERSERLEYIPSRMKVLVQVRKKWACRKCPGEGVITQPARLFGLDKAKAADGLLAKIITDKYADHLPLHRQVKRFRRENGVDLAVSTLCGWLKRSAGLLKHVVAVMADELRAGRFLQSDATGMPILHGLKNRPKRGHLWSYTDGVQVVFEATADGKQAHPAELLAGFRGTLLTDGASVYNAAARADGVVRAGCWAHARRKFFEARREDPVRVAVALAVIREIFVVERELVDLSAEARAKARRERLADRLSRFRTVLDQWSQTTRPKSGMGRAITYARRQWDTLVVFLNDGRAPPDNNASERLLRGPVVGRKNWMFAGSEGGAKAAAVFFSIVASCEMAGVDPFEYLRDVLSLLPDAKPADLKQMTPQAWARDFAEHLEG
jgi:transposase